MNLNNNNGRNWADLPPEILNEIGNQLDTRIQVYRFRSVCTSWRSSLPHSSNQTRFLPLITLPPHKPNEPKPKPGLLRPVTICLLEDPVHRSTFLVKAVETPTGELELFNPLTVPTSGFILGKLVDSRKFRVFEMGKFVFYDGDQIGRKCYIKKVVMMRDYGFIAVFNNGWVKMWRFDSDNWIDLGVVGFIFVDAVNLKGFYYIIDSLGHLYWIDENSNSLDRIQCSLAIPTKGRVINAVESQGCLFAVCLRERGVKRGRPRRKETDSDKYRDVEMKVFKLEEQTWVEVNWLGDQVFVLGREFSFAFSSLDFLGCPRNCVYFVDRICSPERRREPENRYFDAALGGYYGARVFSMDDKSFKDVGSSPIHMLLYNLPKEWYCRILCFP